ncbi:D-alanyl-D-alanine carboxypeptidase [Streptomyces sp. 71268]|uniref:D-alanyl-D-alanine carboxypeptidase n=1 Tax=Streptomyces sp. 71268 TaxID=3002640 RepID=UPI0023F9CA98|nr:D-alanyl-D-alanine carboxypeptidase [Streptomyces sp. 71268]WEV25889.1 D-alanyl-D-alanine carboxypeptidase [Streptomyces sp. 71268]
MNGRAEAPGGASKPSSGASGRSGGPGRRSGGDGTERGASGASGRRGGANGTRTETEPESDQREPAGRERSGDQATAVFTAIRRTPGQASGEPGASGEPRGGAGGAKVGAVGSGGPGKVRDSESDAVDEGADGARDEADNDGTSGSAADGEDRVTTVLRTGPLPTRLGADRSATDASPVRDGATDGDADSATDGEGDEGPDGDSAAASGSSASGSASGTSPASDAEEEDADAPAPSATGDDPAVPVGDARLRAAVAAWVAKAGPDDREDAPGDGGADAGPRTDSATRPGGAGAGERGKGKSGDKGAGDSAATPAGTGAAASGSAADSSDSASDGDSASGSASGSGGVPGTPADRATAVFGAVHGAAAARAARDGATEGGGPKPSGSKGSGTKDRDGEAPGGKDADSEDDTKDSGDSGDGETSGAKGDEAGRTRATGRAAASVDTPTSVFGTLRPREAGAASAGERDSARPGKGENKGESKGTSQSAGKVGSEGDGPDEATDKEPAGESVDRPTTAFKALRPSDLPRDTGSTPSGKGKGAGRGQEPASAERTSQFVPLKSADERPAKPAAGARPAAAAGAGTPTETERTAQQPVLDLPAGAATGAPAAGESAKPAGPPAPLDLLAQLTNTPPPKPTLARTIVRRVKIWTPLVLVLAILFGVAQSLRPLPTPELKLTANSSFSFDGAKPTMPWPTKGQAVVDVEGLGSLGAYGEQKPAPIASVAKVMTAYVIMRDHPMKAGSDGPKIKIDAKAAADAGKDADGESVVKVDEGAQITQREAIESIMIASANNIARLLARWDAGSEAAFVTKMNEAAKDLGMKNTTYTDPSGLNATTVSTAVDQVKLAKKAMDDPVFREVVKMPNYEDSRGDVHGNWNHLVPFNGVVGIKTGTTTKAGGNLVFAAEKKIGGTTQLIIGAVLSQSPAERDNSILTGALDASKKLILKAQDTLQARKVVKKGDVVGEVDDGLGGKTPVVAVKDVTAVGWPGLTVNLDLTDGGEKLPHTQDAGTEIGTLTVGEGPGQVKVPVALGEDLAEPSFGTKLLRVT